MTRNLMGSVIVTTLCIAVTSAHGAPRGGGNRAGGERSSSERTGGERTGGSRSSAATAGGERSTGQSSASRKSPGGAWSEHNPNWRQGSSQFSNPHSQSGAEAAAAGRFTGKQNPGQASGAEGAAAGTAAAKRNAPSATGAQGAAAASAASKRNAPAASGAQGAAAGAAAANRNAPQATGAQGAAAGAAAANRNSPSATGAEGAAAGAAVANRNSPTATGAEGAAAGAAVANRNAPAASGAEGAAAGYAAASGPVEHPSMYDQQWYAGHQNAWAPENWNAGTAWAPVAWNAVAAHCGYTNVTPAPYNYGSNVTCIGGNVVVNGEPAGTAEEFSETAAAIANAGAAAATSATDQWMPLGVFALVRDEHHQPNLMMQLAINQQGILRGNYTDEVTGNTMPIHGQVDQQSGRAAWTIGDNKYSVIEAGLSNLTEYEAPALIHKNGTTQRWLLVRLAAPGPNESAPSPDDAIK